MKIRDRVKFTAKSILWLYYQNWPDSVGVIERQSPDAQKAVSLLDVRFPDGTLVPGPRRISNRP